MNSNPEKQNHTSVCTGGGVVTLQRLAVLRGDHTRYIFIKKTTHHNAHAHSAQEPAPPLVVSSHAGPLWTGKEEEEGRRGIVGREGERGEDSRRERESRERERELVSRAHMYGTRTHLLLHFPHSDYKQHSLLISHSAIPLYFGMHSSSCLLSVCVCNNFAPVRSRRFPGPVAGRGS